MRARARVRRPSSARSVQLVNQAEHTSLACESLSCHAQAMDAHGEGDGEGVLKGPKRLPNSLT